MADNSMTGTFQINLPKDLLSEAKRAPKGKTEQLRVEGLAQFLAVAHIGNAGRQRLIRTVGGLEGRAQGIGRNRTQL